MIAVVYICVLMLSELARESYLTVRRGDIPFLVGRTVVLGARHEGDAAYVSALARRIPG